MASPELTARIDALRDGRRYRTAKADTRARIDQLLREVRG